MKTSDDLILQLVQKEGLDKPITSKDVLYLKEQGVSERVIAYLMKISESKKGKLLAQEGESIRMSDNLRAYYTTTKGGKKVKVVTNMDENGNRLGGELPPPEPAPEESKTAYVSPEPRDIHVIIENQGLYPPTPEEYVETPPVPRGISPYDVYYNSPYPYIPYYPTYPIRPFRTGMRPPSNVPFPDTPDVRIHIDRNLVRPSARSMPSTAPPPPSASGGVRHFKR